MVDGLDLGLVAALGDAHVEHNGFARCKGVVRKRIRALLSPDDSVEPAIEDCNIGDVCIPICEFDGSSAV